jgi:very-short-patch-repair endonuclease
MVPVDGSSRHLMAEIAREQRGHISYAQLLTAGFTADQIRTLQTDGTLHRIHHGVYAVGHLAAIPLGPEAAAILAFQGRAALSHLTALRLYGLLPAEHEAVVDVTIRREGSAHRRRGIRVHRSRTLTDRQIRSLAGLPVTRPERALLDSAPLLTEHQLGRAFDEAIARRLTSYTKLAELVGRHLGHPGQAKLAALVKQRRFPTVTESEAEDRFLALIAEAGLPAPRTQVQMHGFRIDAYWPQARFAVEIDGFQWHNRTKTSFERDRRKQQVLQEHGIEVARTTWAQITEERLQLVAHVAGRLAARRTESVGRLAAGTTEARAGEVRATG